MFTEVDECANNDVTYGIDKIGEAVERWLDWNDQTPSKTSKQPSLYRWMLEHIQISLEKLPHGFVISAQYPSFCGMRKNNLVKITPPFNVEIIPVNHSVSLEKLAHEITMMYS